MPGMWSLFSPAVQLTLFHMQWKLLSGPLQIGCKVKESVKSGQWQLHILKKLSCLVNETSSFGSNPAKAIRIFQGGKILSTPSFGREVKPWVPCRRFAACKRSLNWCGSRNFRQNYLLILAHIVPPFATRISHVVLDMGAPGSERGNIQTGRGDRVSTISLLGCSTSVALATGPTDEEETKFWQTI